MDTTQSNSQLSLPTHLEMFVLRENPSPRNKYLRPRLSVSVQSLNRVRLFATPWTVAQQASLSSTTSQSLLKLMCIQLVIPSHHLILCCPLLPPSIFLSIKWVSSSHQVATGLELQHQSFQWIYIQDWFPLRWTGWTCLQSTGLSESLLKHHSSKASILWHSAFFIVHLSQPHMTTGKTTALTRQTSVGKVMSLFFNVLSRLVIAFFQGASVFWFHGCRHHLQWVILEPQKINSLTVSIVSPSTCHVSPSICHEDLFHPCFSIYLPWRLICHKTQT